MNSPDPGLISPGLLGFLATFAVVVAAVLLFLSMTRHLRKVDYRSQRLPEEPRDAEDFADERPDERPDEGQDEAGDTEPDGPSGR